MPGNEGLKGYGLKDSFMGGEGADLVMLAASRLPAAEPLGGLHPLRCARGIRPRERWTELARKTTERLAGMAKSQLRDYARERLQMRHASSSRA